MRDVYNLHRFVLAQDAVYDDVLGFLRRGMMCTSCMEFIFPSLTPIRGRSRPYAIGSLDEARAYLSSPILGGRYRQCVETLQRLHTLRADRVFGTDDAAKLHASLTLFSEAASEEFLLETIFDIWFDGLVDEATMNQIRRMSYP